MKLLFLLLGLCVVRCQDDGLATCMAECGSDHQCMGECEDAWADPLSDEVDHGEDHRREAFIGDLIGVFINKTSEQSRETTKPKPEKPTQNETDYDFESVHEVGTTFALANHDLPLHPPLLPLLLTLLYNYQ